MGKVEEQTKFGTKCHVLTREIWWVVSRVHL